MEHCQPELCGCPLCPWGHPPQCWMLSWVGWDRQTLPLGGDALLPIPQVPVLRPMDLMVEATPRRVFANAHTYHINSISVNSDYETYMSADDLRINLWNFEITNQSFSILWRAVPCGPWDGPSLAKSSNKGGASSDKWDVRALGPLTCANVSGRMKKLDRETSPRWRGDL